MSDDTNSGLRRRLSTALVGVALISVLLLAAVNYTFARLLIDDSVEEQLEAVRDTRVQALEVGAARIQSRVATLAANPSVVDALVDLSVEFQQLDEDITADERAELARIYDAEVLPPFVDAGVTVSGTDLIPASTAGRYIQHHYIAENPDGFDQREQLVDAGDGSGYSAAHSTHHPLLRSLMQNAGMSDLLFVAADTGDVVYSTKKRIDLGTNGISGPYSVNVGGESAGLGVVLERLSGVAVGDAVISDSVFYVPTAGVPVFFVAAAVRLESDVIGALVTEVPAEALTQIMTARRDWTLLGLGDTGESYIVGADGTLRSDSRVWLQDPDEYLRRHLDRYDNPEATGLIETIGSPVLLQEVDNAAVSAALDDREFIGTVTSYLGNKTLAASGPARTAGPDWAVIVEIDRSETDAALDSFVRRILLVLAILLPTMALIGVFLARILTRPAESLLRSAAGIADGALETEVEDLGRNELGDLGRQLEGVAHQLDSREREILDEEQHINDMLTALLPARLVDRVRRGEQAIGDVFDTATVVSITIDHIPEATGADHDLALEITDRIDEEVQALMERFEIERIQRSSGSQLFVAGLDQDDPRANAAAAFAVAAIATVDEVGAEFEQTLSVRVGLSAGDVATGVLGSSQPSFGVWGDPPGTAVTLAGFAQPGEVLADGNVVGELGREWDIGPTLELPGLADDIDARAVNGRVEVPVGRPNAD